MRCPVCGGEAASGGHPCAACSELRKTDPDRYAALVNEKLRSSSSREPGLFAEYRQHLLTGALGCALLLLWLLYSRGVFGFGSLPPLPDTAYGGAQSQCQGREKCLVAFFAPWCSACRASHPFMQALQTRFATEGRVGVQVVVGRDDESSLYAMAAEIGGAVRIDLDGQFARGAGVRAVPIWWLIDDQRKILKVGSGLFSTPDPNARETEYFIREQLGLAD